LELYCGQRLHCPVSTKRVIRSPVDCRHHGHQPHLHCPVEESSRNGPPVLVELLSLWRSCLASIAICWFEKCLNYEEDDDERARINLRILRSDGSNLFHNYCTWIELEDDKRTRNRVRILRWPQRRFVFIESAITEGTIKHQHGINAVTTTRFPSRHDNSGLCPFTQRD
jgi:hypothetical protein